MTDRQDGGQAFPHGNPTHGGDIGMTLRDWFAGMALQGLLASPRPCVPEEKPVTDYVLASFSYTVADAMLKERTKQ